MLDIGLRFFPVNEGLRALPVNQQNPILRFTPDRVSTWSRGWNFPIVTRVETNNYGFISGVDYDSQATTPLLAIIGDSYVEAAMVSYDRTAAGILEETMHPDGRVYSFGASGSALSQYLAYCEYARDTFHPVAFIIVIVSNDFDESLLKYKSAPGFHYFVENRDGELVLTRVDFQVTVWRDLVRRSALGMYLATNLDLSYVWGRLKDLISPSAEANPVATGNAALLEPTRVTDSQRAVDAFLRLLPSMAGVDPSRIALILDAMRETVYDPDQLEAGHGSFFDVMRRYLVEKAQVGGFEIIDMQPEFLEHYKRHGQRFEFETDDHWNALGHAVVADAVQRSRLYRTMRSLVPEQDVN
jgi:hypothetical protein